MRRVTKYYEVDAGKARYRQRVAELAGPGQRMLDYGCGPGGLSVANAVEGASVTGIDISPVAVKNARKAARKRGVEAKYVVTDAEALDFADDSFDVVYGSGILHHLDIDRAYREIARVLAPEGRAVFVEPLGHNPAINLYRRCTPSMRTPDEHPLLQSDFELAEQHFRTVSWEPFDLVAFAGVPLRGFAGSSSAIGALHRIDQWLFDRAGVFRRWAWVAVIELGN